MKENPSIPHKKVAVAVIGNKNNEILIAKRLPGGSMGRMWEFPGGKIEADETVVECIIREIQEELAITIAVKEHLISIEHTYKDFHITLIAYLCFIPPLPQEVAAKNPEPKPLACSEIRWVKIDLLDRYQFPAANLAIIEALKNYPQQQQLFV
ncbi:MAG: 8-oxo-dGTP diphosphatase MutT [Prochloraceae cyanobacterium]